MKILKKISIRTQVFVALITVIIIMASIFSPYGFYTNVTSIRHSIDERLVVAANGMKEFVPADFNDRAIAGKVSQAEYKELQSKVIQFQKTLGLTYLYMMIQAPDGEIYFTLDQEEDAMTPYKNPSTDSLEVFKTKKPVYAQCDDSEFGLTARTVLLPYKTPNGQFYVIGADMNITKIRPMILKSLADFFLLLLIGIFLVLFITMRLSRQISQPIKKLSEFTQKLAESNFSPKLDMAETIKDADIKTNEVAILADSIGQMRNKLDEYLANLKDEMAARNRAESELKIAGGIQESFLPGNSIATDFIHASAKMKPAKKAGGDLYDFFKMSDGRICLAIGDVSGKGMPAALFMARAISFIRSGAYISNSLPQIVKFINDMLSESNESCTFITFFICAYDEKTGELEFVNCGHNPPYFMKSGRVEMLKPKVNKILGVFGGFDFESEKLTLSVGDTLVCYTDGVTEALSKESTFYGDERLEKFLGGEFNKNTSEIVDDIMNSVFSFSENCEQSDDITVLTIKRTK